MKSLNVVNTLLLYFVGFISLLIFGRILYCHTDRFIFLLWNIFLGWIPYALSSYFSVYSHKEKWKQLVLFGSWLLFFPNALYIVTDLVHLEESSTMPLWYDAVLLFASSFFGLVMAFVSLQKVEFYLSNIFRPTAVKIMILSILFTGSFGVYLGRFQRWNSWDIIHNPLGLGIDIITMCIFPFSHIKTWAVTVILTILYSLVYYCIKILPNIYRENLNN